MLDARLTRRQLLALGGTFSLARFLSPPELRAHDLQPLRIGAVVPARTGEGTVRASVNDHTGEGARMGAIFGAERLGDQAGDAGLRLDLLLASSPSADAARRAGRRLVATEGIHALVGGIGQGQAEALAAVAEEARVPFFNIGSSRDDLRHGACGRYTFHVEASAAMYLDASVGWHAGGGRRRWFCVHESTAEGATRLRRARTAIARYGQGGDEVGSSATAPGQPLYLAEIEAALVAQADVLLLLLDPIDQIGFLAQQESRAPDLPVSAYPEALGQTRDYIAAARHLAPATNPEYRIGLWETTSAGDGAEEFNERFQSRWGEPADPTAWAAYHSVQIVLEAARAAASVQADALVEYLESPGTVFDVRKGRGVSFRRWDHQLRQPLHVLQVDQDAVWTPTSISSRVGVASFVGRVPDVTAGEPEPIAVLDRLGDGPTETACLFGTPAA